MGVVNSGELAGERDLHVRVKANPIDRRGSRCAGADTVPRGGTECILAREPANG